jgi:hypothetical protein
MGDFDKNRHLTILVKIKKIRFWSKSIFQVGEMSAFCILAEIDFFQF